MRTETRREESLPNGEKRVVIIRSLYNDTGKKTVMRVDSDRTSEEGDQAPRTAAEALENLL